MDDQPSETNALPPDSNLSVGNESPRRRSALWWMLVGIAVLIPVGLGITIFAVGGIEPFGDLISPTLVEVTGKVTYKGKPLEAGFVQTYYERRGWMGALGVIEPDGTFRLATNGDPGALSGTHRVVVSWMDNSFPPRHLLPQKYTDPRTTPFLIRISRSGRNVVQLDLDDTP